MAKSMQICFTDLPSHILVSNRFRRKNASFMQILVRPVADQCVIYLHLISKFALHCDARTEWIPKTRVSCRA